MATSSNRPPETIMSSPELKLSARGAGQGEYAKFGWQWAFNSLGTTFFDGRKEGANRFFNVKVKMPTLAMYCNELINASLPGPYSIPEGMEIKLYQGKGSDKKHAGSLIVGKDEDGLIWTAIAKEGFFKAKFYFTLPEGVVVVRLGGGEVTKAEISSRRARAHAETLTQAALLTWGNKFDPDAGNDFNNKDGGNSGGGYGGNKPANGGADDDIEGAIAGSGW